MLQFNNVEFNYNGNKIFSDLSFTMEQGEFLFLMGKSGSGKSTLLQMIYMNLFPQSGIVKFEIFSSDKIKRSEIPLLRRRIGIIFQDYKLLNDRNIYQNLEFVLEVVNTPVKEIKKKINNVLSDVGLLQRRYSYPDELSGGEKQKVAIARAIINDPVLVLADEPTGNLDPDTTNDIVEVIKRINARGTAVLFATHNYDIVKKNSMKVLKIEDHKVVKGTIKQKV